MKQEKRRRCPSARSVRGLGVLTMEQVKERLRRYELEDVFEVEEYAAVLERRGWEIVAHGGGADA